MPSIVIVAATDMELSYLLKKLNSTDQSTSTETENSPPFERTFSLKAIGIGKAASAMGLTELLLKEDDLPLGIILLGCAGAYPKSDLRLGDVVLGTESILADEGFEGQEEFLDLEKLHLPTGETPNGEKLFNRFKGHLPSPEILENFQSLNFAVISGNISTVSSCTGSLARAQELESRWELTAEGMEGASTALVAHSHGIPFIEVRGISNEVGPRDREAWNIPLACENAAKVVNTILQSSWPSG